jgi:hypothetical protein
MKKNYSKIQISTLSTVQHKDNPDAVDKMVEDLEKQ